MEPNDLELWRQSADAWMESQGRLGDASRQFLDPYVWAAIGAVEGLAVLDVGCGEGRFGRLLTESGAKVTGLEPIPEFAGRSGYPTAVGLGEVLPFKGASFDIVLFYLVLIDIEAYDTAIQEAARVLRSGGRIIAVNLTPISTATHEPFWERDANGVKVARRIEFYGTPQGQVYEWSGIRIRNYHRPLRDYMRAYLAAKLRLISYNEPMDENEISDSVISPNFDIMVWGKE